MSDLSQPFNLKDGVKLGTGKAAGLGQPGKVPANYNPDPENPLSLYRNGAGCTRESLDEYIMAIDGWNWENYDYAKWPCADLSFPDLDEDKEYDLWPYKPDLGEAHWVDLNNQFKFGLARKVYVEGKSDEYSTPDAYVGKDAAKILIELEALAKGNDEGKIQAAGFKNLEHLQFVMAFTKREVKEANAAAQNLIDQLDAESKKKMSANIDQARKGGLLDPIQGVSMEDWAAANAKIAQGMPFAEILKVLGVEKPTWDEVSAQWMSRMTQDTTFAISKVYGDAFVNPNMGKFAQGGAAAPAANPTVEAAKNDLDLYVKIMCHQSAGAMQGLDANAVLKQYGLTGAEWGAIGMHWSSQMANLETSMKMAALMEKYSAEFAGSAPAKAGDDIDF